MYIYTWYYYLQTEHYSLISAAPKNPKLAQLKGGKGHKRSVSSVSATTTVSSLIFSAGKNGGTSTPERSDSDRSVVRFVRNCVSVDISVCVKLSVLYLVLLSYCIQINIGNSLRFLKFQIMVSQSDVWLYLMLYVWNGQLQFNGW